MSNAGGELFQLCIFVCMLMCVTALFVRQIIYGDNVPVTVCFGILEVLSVALCRMAWREYKQAKQ